MQGAQGCETLILLVGSNPLPNYVAARVLEPKKILLLYTTETEPVMEQLKAELAQHSPTPCHCTATDPHSIRKHIPSEITSGVHLNYTGGTKVMAAHARAAFAEHGGRDSQVSYIDDRAGCLRFDDGYEISLRERDCDLSLTRIARLHKIEIKADAVVDGGPTLDDARETLARVLSDPSTGARLREEGARLKKLKKVALAVNDPFRPQDAGLRLSVDEIPATGWNDKRFKAWYTFFGKHVWLEVCVAGWVQELTGCEPSRGVHCSLPNGRQFEVDVAVTRSHKLFLLSCTTDETLEMCKLKLFEAATRARRLGGELTRWGIVCHLKEGALEKLRQDVEDTWDAPNKPGVFGAGHLREWTGLSGRKDLAALEEWLDS